MTEKEKNEMRKELRREFASQGGVARSKNLTKKRRTEIAKKAANARWKKAAK